jgi:hypothetical protein
LVSEFILSRDPIDQSKFEIVQYLYHVRIVELQCALPCRITVDPGIVRATHIHEQPSQGCINIHMQMKRCFFIEQQMLLSENVIGKNNKISIRRSPLHL